MHDPSHQDLIDAGLEALRAAMPLALCAYVHRADDDAPHLTLATPRMDEIEPDEAFAIFAALREAVDGDHTGGDIQVDSFASAAVTTRGPRSRGLHVIGRRAAPLDDAERALFRRLATGLGNALHILESAQARARLSPTEPIRVSVDITGRVARAEVAIPIGDELRTGLGESNHSQRAVAVAVCDAIEASLKIIEAGSGDVADERAALVLVEDEFGRRSIGSGLVADDRDLLQATASAAMDAAQRLIARSERRRRTPFHDDASSPA